MIMNLSGGGKPQNVLVVYVKESGATITATNGVETLTKVTDSAGYAYFTNLAIGTWTLSAVDSFNHPAPSTPTVTITATQISYYVAFGFEFWLYDNSFADITLNQCVANSGGWSGTMDANATNISTRGSGGGRAVTGYTFDMSNYRTLSLYYKLANGHAGNMLRVFASDGQTTIASVELSGVTDPTWVTLDISGVTALGYVAIGAWTYDVITMYKCYLA